MGHGAMGPWGNGAMGHMAAAVRQGASMGTHGLGRDCGFGGAVACAALWDQGLEIGIVRASCGALL